MKKDSKENQAKYVELNLFPEEIEDHQKDSVSSDSKENHTSSDKEYDLTDLFERLSGSAFRSRSISRRRIRNILQKRDWLPSVSMRRISLPNVLLQQWFPMTASRHRWEVILYSLPSMLPAAAAVVVSSNGIIYLPEDSWQKKNSNMQWRYLWPG